MTLILFTDLLGIEYLIKEQLSYETYNRWRRRCYTQNDNQESFNEGDFSCEKGNGSLQDIDPSLEDSDSLQQMNSLPEDNGCPQDPLQEYSPLREDNNSLQGINSLPEDTESCQDLLEEKPFLKNEALLENNPQENSRINKVRIFFLIDLCRRF